MKLAVRQHVPQCFLFPALTRESEPPPESLCLHVLTGLARSIPERFCSTYNSSANSLSSGLQLVSGGMNCCVGPELLQAFSSPSDEGNDDDFQSEVCNEDLSDRLGLLGHDTGHRVNLDGHLSSAVRHLPGDDGFACDPSVSPLAASPLGTSPLAAITTRKSFAMSH